MMYMLQNSIISKNKLTVIMPKQYTPHKLKFSVSKKDKLILCEHTLSHNIQNTLCNQIKL